MARDGALIPGQTVEFEQILPCSDDFIRENIRHSLSLGLPEIDTSEQRITIVANGPSARGRDYVGTTMALNGAIRLPCFKDVGPTYWCVADPQAPDPSRPEWIVPADFLPDDPPKDTIYLVASKCHRSVFDKLKDRDVRLWHLDDIEWGDLAKGLRLVPCASSVTITAICLAQRLGYRFIDTWGWDCSFGEDGSHHAAMGELGVTPEQVTVRVGAETWGEHFRTTPTWGYEAEQAVNTLSILRWAGCEVKIHGPGMVRAMAMEFAKTPLQIIEREGIFPCPVG